ncbi:hypothetical protein CH253_08285 [Rhodococcus sp. 06-156-3C]|uniref:hypothetical protein n=1 Tax=Rhodococcus sp. 06-156-3C TaxID=2022486 RepID=UPI000B9B1FE6|nr:hypothetical protein [Rhodococcus sp. 06-156-3C]OZD23844.1 hypothetical protein CH253_08285 [Rhodococcus sp. 06-156-3C]
MIDGPLSAGEVAKLRGQVEYAAQQAAATKGDRDARLASTQDDETVNPVVELRELIADTWDAVEFLRSQMFKGGRPMDGADQSRTEREESGDKVSTGAKPKSRPPFSLDAMECADLEVATLVDWAEHLGFEPEGWVWRVNGIPRGVLYGDMRPVRSLSRVLDEWLAEGWIPPEQMLSDIRGVRTANRKAWPELDVLLGQPSLDEPVEEEPALF